MSRITNLFLALIAFALLWIGYELHNMPHSFPRGPVQVMGYRGWEGAIHVVTH